MAVRSRDQRLSFVLDRFGQLAILDGNEELLAMFVAFRDRWAAWMPDGTRLGNLSLSLGPATPGAAENIGPGCCARAERTGDKS